MSVQPDSIFPAGSPPDDAIGPVVIPVLHILTIEHAIEEARAAFRAGARGVFLIDHRGDRFLPIEAAKGVRQDCLDKGLPAPWIGVNLLGTSPRAAVQRVRLHAADVVSAIWTDESGLANPGSIQIERRAYADMAPPRPSPLLFAGCHFKHQDSPFSLEAEAGAMVEVGIDVLTTSGDATGLPCDPEKVRRIRKAVGPQVKIAVASGVSLHNAAELVEAGANVLMAATHISRSFNAIDPDKLRELIARVEGSKTPPAPLAAVPVRKKKGARP